MSKETGGPAFPCDRLITPDGDLLTSNGMTMRDYFAAKAMQANARVLSKGATLSDITRIAEDAYLFADAMLKAREK